ncbi:MAG TPA: hypothetical protein VKR24_02575 [Candidatus Limnocylindrales bacterium]|nr:hypothetical protein [Candidatus Limnocylindrales bacterium]
MSRIGRGGPAELLLEHEFLVRGLADGSDRPELDHSAALGGI